MFQLIFSIQVIDSKNGPFMMFNNLGQIVCNGQFDSTNNRIEIPTHLHPGIFYVQIFDKKGQRLGTSQLRIQK